MLFITTNSRLSYRGFFLMYLIYVACRCNGALLINVEEYPPREKTTDRWKAFSKSSLSLSLSPYIFLRIKSCMCLVRVIARCWPAIPLAGPTRVFRPYEWAINFYDSLSWNCIPLAVVLPLPRIIEKQYLRRRQIKYQTLLTRIRGRCSSLSFRYFRIFSFFSLWRYSSIRDVDRWLFNARALWYNTSRIVSTPYFSFETLEGSCKGRKLHFLVKRPQPQSTISHYISNYDKVSCQRGTRTHRCTLSLCKSPTLYQLAKYEMMIERESEESAYNKTSLRCPRSW